MAALIPVEGEIITLDLPEDPPAVLTANAEDKLGGEPIPLQGTEGDEWWLIPQASGASNERATRWARAAGVMLVGDLYGPVLFLSAEEAQTKKTPAPRTESPPVKWGPATETQWDPLFESSEGFGTGTPASREDPTQLNSASLPPGYPLIEGDGRFKGTYQIAGSTYPVRDELKKLGARFNPDSRKWYIRPELLPTAAAIVSRGP